MLMAGCGGEKPPRTLDEIFNEERALPKLYFTAITQKRITAPATIGPFVDKETGEICWPALECINPQCPGRAADGSPFLFISPDNPYVAKPDGTAVPGNPDPKTVRPTGGQCPQCFKIRNRNTESAAVKQKYINMVIQHVLPESQARAKELEQERLKRYEFEKNAH